MNASERTPQVAVVGAGPAGLFAARALAQQGVQVALLNRTIRPGGLAEYGIYYDKHKLKAGLRRQFLKALSEPGVRYFGFVEVGEGREVTLEMLRQWGFDAVLVAAGSQKLRRIGIPGEDAQGRYHAAEVYYHYNGLPPYSTRPPQIGQRVILIGIGNVMVDIATYLIRARKVAEVTAVARCGPCEIKFARKEFLRIAAHLDAEDFEREAQRVAERVRRAGENLAAARSFVLGAHHRAPPDDSPSRFTFRFLSLPRRILTDASGRVRGLEVEDTYLEFGPEGRPIPHGLGTTRVLEADTVIYCIGTEADPTLGLPVWRGSFATHPRPRYPIHHTSYEAYDPQSDRPLEGVFVAGWSRQANFGLVGTVRKDGERAAEAVLRYLAGRTPQGPAPIAALERHLAQLPHPVVDKAALERLLQAEAEEASRRGEPHFRFTTNEDMLRAAGLG